MKFFLGVAVLIFLVTGTLTDDDLNLADAFGDDDVKTTPPKPAEKPKADGGFELDLGDALGPGPTKPPKADKPAVIPPKSGGDDSGFDLGDALGPDPNPKTEKPKVVEPKNGGGGGGSFDDSSLFEVAQGDYKPDGGRSGGRASNFDDQGGADEPKAEAGSGQIAGIASAIGVALLGAASSYFAYQKKKLCFKLQGGTDPESGKGGRDAHSDPQSLSNLLRTN